MIINRIDAGFSNYLVPAFTYTGDYTVVDDGAAGWRIKFLSSGTLVMNQRRTIDVFCVGGGASGSYGGISYSGIYSGGTGGAGGYTKTSKKITAVAGKSYTITVGKGGASVGGSASPAAGKAGGSTSAFGITAAGGTIVTEKPTGSSYNYYRPGNGGSGGGGAGQEQIGHIGSKGGTDGGNGYYWDSSSNSSKIAPNSYTYAQGQHTTTREFGEAGATLYSGGGGGGGSRYSGTTYAPGAGGAGGGGKGAAYNAAAVAGTANTGGGGGGGYFSSTSSYRRASGAGGSGIVIIRNAR